MLISLNWLQDFIDLKINENKSDFENVVVGFVEKVEKHPDADSLMVASVDVGEEKLQIVCGGKNLKEGIYVPVAKTGAILPGNFTIKKCKLRGVESNGMICHLSELGIGEDEGKMISPLQKQEPGTPFAETIDQSGYSPEELGNLLTLKTAEVEKVEQTGQGFEDVVVGELVEFERIPDTDSLHKAKVDIGRKEPIQLIFGMMVKMNIGDHVPVAVAPTTLPSGIKIDKKKIRGVMTEGMLCLDQELGLKKDGVSIQYFPDLKPGTPLKKHLVNSDITLEFDNKSLTHRPDLWGHYGIAREVAAITKTPFKQLTPKVDIPSSGDSVDVKIEDFELCPRYCGLIIENITVQDSPDWLANRLRATGHGVHSNIVDVTNYIMHELGQPMHAFDKNFIKGGIIVRPAKKGEKITTLDDKERELDESNLVIADHEKAVAIAGVMGGQNSEIKPETTAIILESANFNGGSIRRTSTKHGLRTDAVQHFEKSLDPHLAELAILRAAELILQICPEAKIAGPITDTKQFKEKPDPIELNTEKTASKIGVPITPEQIKEILESLEFKVEDKGTPSFTVTPPTHRASKDVSIEDDLIEEVARIYGYDEIPAELPALPIKLPAENKPRKAEHQARRFFSNDLGFDEVKNYSFYGEDELKRCQMSEEGHIKVLNYLSTDQTHMRTSMIPNLLKNLQLNIKNYDNINIYEIGRTYKEIGEFMPQEETQIAGAVLSKSENTFYKAKGALEKYLCHAGIAARPVKEASAASYAHPNRIIEYQDAKGNTIAKVFEVHPVTAKNHDLQKFHIAFFVIKLSQALKLEKPEHKFKSIARFPSITFDVSVLIDKETPINKLQNAIKQAHTELISNIELFDIYEGENIDQDKKAVAFKITLQAPDRTLTDAEMAEIQQKVFSNLEKLGGTIRGK